MGVKLTPKGKREREMGVKLTPKGKRERERVHEEVRMGANQE